MPAARSTSRARPRAATTRAKTTRPAANRASTTRKGGGGRPKSLAKSLKGKGRLRIGHKSSGTPISRGIRWDRLPGNWMLLIVIVMAVLYVPPLHSYINQRHETTAAKAQLQDLGKENRALRQRAKALKRNSTIEMEARKLGMVKPDERPYVILK